MGEICRVHRRDVRCTQNYGRKTQRKNLVIVVARDDAEVHLLALQTMTEQFLLCEWGHCCLAKLHHCLEVMSGSWDAPDYPTYTPLQ
jgi:hypothetical protein